MNWARMNIESDESTEINYMQVWTMGLEWVLSNRNIGKLMIEL